MPETRETVRYRVAQNEWNLKQPPWSGAVGIEEVAYWEDGSEIFAVPPLVCWLLRGSDPSGLAERIVAGLNSDQEWLAERAKHLG
jgi:hypothetical protein